MRKVDAGLAGVRGTAGGALLIGGILVVSFNMRAAITSLPPVFPELRHAAGLSNATLAALAAVPVLSFALFSGLAPVLARKIGEERVIILALGLLAVGLGLRSAAPGVLLFPGTIVAAGAISLVNVLLPSLVKRRKPELAGLLIGLYLMSLTAGAVLAAVIAVPVFNAAGSAAVRLTLGMWAAPALIAIFVWLPQARFRTRPDIKPGDERRGVREMTRHKLAWQVMSFMGLQSLAYYATLSWFPTMFRDHGISATAAGNLLALMNLGNAVSGLIVPVLAQRARDQRKLVVVAVALIAAGLVGSAFGRGSTVIGFVCLLGLGQGALVRAQRVHVHGQGGRQPHGGRAVRLRPGRRLPDRGGRPAAGRHRAHSDRLLDDPDPRVASRGHRAVGDRPAGRPGPRRSGRSRSSLRLPISAS